MLPSDVPRDEELDGLRDGESEQGGDEGVVVEDGEVGESRCRRRRRYVVGSNTVPHGRRNPLAPGWTAPARRCPCLILPRPPSPAARVTGPERAPFAIYIQPSYPRAPRSLKIPPLRRTRGVHQWRRRSAALFLLLLPDLLCLLLCSGEEWRERTLSYWTWALKFSVR